jgi:hypothetical protein
MATGYNIRALYIREFSMNIEEFNYKVNLLQAILWQYDESTNLLSLINQKQNWYDLYQTQFWIDWYTNVFNLLTANGFGLSVWSYILFVPLFFENIPESSDAPIWGFNQILSYPTLENTYLNFENSNFSSKGTAISLTLEEQRFLLRLRYFQLSNRGSITVINDFFNYLVSTSNIGYSGTIYALDGLNMTMTYIFTSGDFSQNLFDAIQTLDLFPRPVGVGIKVHINYGFQFGFNAGTFEHYENTNRNFSNGNFIDPFILSFTEREFIEQVMVTESKMVMVSESGEVMITE